MKRAGTKRIVAVTVLSAPKGVGVMAARHPGLPIYTGALDTRLTANNYILPGLGDAGDRLFGTVYPACCSRRDEAMKQFVSSGLDFARAFLYKPPATTEAGEHKAGRFRPV